MGKGKKVLIINECFSDNVGDQAIAEGLNCVFSECGYDISNVGFSAARLAGESVHADISKYGVGFKRFLSKSIALRSLRWLFLNVRRVIRVSAEKREFVVIGGGQLIMEKSNFAIAMFAWVFFLKIFRHKIYLVSVGVGEGFNILEKVLYFLSFKMVDRVYLREISGIQRLRVLFNTNAYYSPDAAYALPVAQVDLNDRLRVAICITSYDIYQRHAIEFGSSVLSRAKYWEEWMRLIECYASDNKELRFLWTTESDKKETADFLNNVTLTCPYTVFEENLSLASVLDELLLVEKVISGRMHGLILGHICGAKPVPWMISKKIEHFADEYLPESPQKLHGQLLEVVRRDFM